MPESPPEWLGLAEPAAVVFVRLRRALAPSTEAARNETLAAEAMRARRLSARGFHRVLRVARTLADLAGSDEVRTADLAFALLLRAQA